MRSNRLHLQEYDSDKIESHYLQVYDPIFSPWVDKKVNLLEIGIYKGGSLLLWRDYFTMGTITGIDIQLPKDFAPPERIHIFEGSQADKFFLSKVANQVAPEGFDIIIDDASHIGELTKTSFWHLFDNHLKSGGLYVIEDWGTGYWDNWIDGKSLDMSSYFKEYSQARKLWHYFMGRLGVKFPMPCHSYGMVGFVKQLVDEQAAHDVTRKSHGGKSKRGPKFKSIIFTPSIVFVQKA